MLAKQKAVFSLSIGKQDKSLVGQIAPGSQIS